MAAVEKRIDEAIGRWRILAVTCRLLESIRESYERERQPETLKEASGYLARLTQGRYVRVWTPLGEKTLRVDDSEGHSLPVESLSRGTREQLFLSLRLALAASFARRGAALPMVLDDVLVNFDTGRATAAAELLRDFAARGHQLLVCTCHEHIEAIFARLDASPCRLPIALQSEGAVVSFGRAERVEEPKREKVRPPRKKPVKEKIEEVVPPPPPVEEIVEPPAKKPSRAKKTPPKPPAKPHGVFDVDFFEEDKNEPIAEEEEDIESEEIEEEDLEEDESLWDEEELEEEFEEEDEIDDEDIEAA
jgi:ABC-type multidrug transport system ATPase subunit